MIASPLIAPIFRHSTLTPDKLALVIDSVGTLPQLWTYAELVRDVASFSGAENPGSLLFDPKRKTRDQVISALYRLNAGNPIIGSTSGSTGQAKRYQRSQDSWVASFSMDQNVFGLKASDVIIAPGSLTHSLFSYALCHGLYLGATVILTERFRPTQVLELIGRYQATVLYGVPTQLKLIVQNSSDTAQYSSIRWVLSSGAAWFEEITPLLRAIFTRAQIAEFYGASELSFVSVAMHTGETVAPECSVGTLIPGVELQVTGDLLWVSSPGIFDGYIDDVPEDYHERIDLQGRRWVSVGDLGRIDENGALYLSGRASRKIIVSGKNLYPEEVEQLLQLHPGISHAAVLGRKDLIRGERLIAILMLLDSTLQRGELITFLRSKIEDFKVPRDFYLAATWPMTTSDKTDFPAIEHAFNQGEFLLL